VTLQRLGPVTYYLLAAFVSPAPRHPWVSEVEDFLTQTVPAGIRDGKESGVALVLDDTGAPVAGIAYRRDLDRPSAALLQAFVVHPNLRGAGRSEAAFVEARDALPVLVEGTEYVTWAVNEGNTVMLDLSNKTGVELQRADGYVYFVHP
jgi:GNAT superfamily N-acetyltransferase